MNRNKLKTYAPAARREFIQAVKDRAVLYGLSAKKIEPTSERGDVVLIAGQPFPKSVAAKRKRLEERIAGMGFERAMEAVAYSWFNRFVAIRFMELHGYLDHGYRVLSHPTGDVQPEILEHAQRVDFPGLDKNKVVELKLDGTKQEELYRLLLVAQCNALSQAMPFLFERIDDETELLLPGNLLATDSLIQKLVNEIDEEDWKEVEILGWLYQFYISERKDEVIGKVVASEDIPAATQLFTPNWIVKYLVQNTLGRIWLATYPQSGIRQQMEFYIEPAEQTPEVQEQLKAITPTSLNPEELTLLDPACGSAHILVEAYDLFKAIYQERGYRAKDIPGLILRKNLYGLEIDDRAAQLAAFSLLMKARADDRRILESGVQPAILSFVESKGMDADAITHALNSPINGEKGPPSEFLLKEVEEAEMPLLAKQGSSAGQPHVAKADIATLLEVFEEAKTFGSLIQIPAGLADKLPAIEERLAAVLKDGDLTHAQAGVIAPLLRQAMLLARQYDAVVANPPYMGSKYFTPTLKSLVNADFKEAKADLYSCFMQRNSHSTMPYGFHGMINIPNWMFLSSFEDLRKSLFETQSIDTFLHNGRGVFGSDFGSCAFVIRKTLSPEYRGSYRKLFEKQGSVASNEELRQRFHTSGTYTPRNADFAKLPGTPIAYWANKALVDLFSRTSRLGEAAVAKVGLLTSDNARFLRYWWEVSTEQIGLHASTSEEAAQTGKRWFPHNKGGAFRKWAGNQEYLVDWQDGGARIKKTVLEKYPYLNGNPNFVVHDDGYYFRPSVSWSEITISATAFRYYPAGFTFNVKGMSAFPTERCSHQQILALCNTKLVSHIVEMLNPTVGFGIANFNNLPAAFVGHEVVAPLVDQLVSIAQRDWDSMETSWGFTASALSRCGADSLRISHQFARNECIRAFSQTKELEEENNRLVIEAYGLQDELSPEVPEDQITLYRPDREEDIKRLLSYAIGCMMGRYSRDKEGLIYAHSGNQFFDASQYTKLPADDDGIIPVTETPWFDDDAANRFERFVKTVWPVETLEENLAFVAESLGEKKSETPRETIRRYFAGDFYKHHLQTYKNRPIYWLFSSGKQGAFEALVYLHRYNEGTLSRMRTEYVVPLLGKMNGRLGMLADVIAKATSTKQRKDAEKEKDKLAKQLAELQAFDDKLRHYADQRISLDLDDGVRVNYGKFGDLLADVKKVCGKTEEE
jgi:hypothetical protein